MPGPLAAVALGLELANSASGLYHSLKGGGGGQPTMPAQLPEPNYDFLRWLVERGNVPSYQGGTDYQGGGLSLVGENGPELAPLAAGPVIPADLLDFLMASHAGATGGTGLGAGIEPSQPVPNMGTQMPDRTGILATLAKGLGPSPFTPGSGSAGFLTELIAHALAGRNKRRPNIAGPLVAALAATGGNIAANRELQTQAEQDAFNTRQRAEAVRKTQNDVMTSRQASTAKALAARMAGQQLAQHRWTEAEAAKQQIFPDVIGAGRKLTGAEYNAALAQHGSLKERFLSGQLSPAERQTYLAGEKAIADATQRAPTMDPGTIPIAGNMVVTGQSKLTDWQGKDRDEIAAWIARSGGTIIPQKARDTIGALNAGKVGVNALRGLVSQVNVGHGAGGYVAGAKAVYRGVVNQDPIVRRYQARKKSLLAVLSRATGERGVLTDKDVQRAAAMLPAIYESTESATGKLQDFEDYMDELRQRTLDTFTTAGAGVAPKPKPASGANVIEEWTRDASGKLVKKR